MTMKSVTYPRGHGVAGNHDDGADGAVLGDETSGFTTNSVSRIHRSRE